MRLDWILSPVTQAGMLAAGLGLALHLFCTLKIEIRAMALKCRPEDPGAEPAAVLRDVAELRRRLDELVLLYGESRERAGMPEAGAVPGAGVKTGVNLERRVHALRRYRRGETAEQIARSLAVPKEEVRLLIKVHKILIERTLESEQGNGEQHAARNAPHPFERKEELKAGQDAADMC